MKSKTLRMAIGLLLVPAFFSTGASGDGCGGGSQLSGTMGAANAAPNSSSPSDSPSGTGDNAYSSWPDEYVTDTNGSGQSSNGSQEFGESCNQQSPCASGLACTGGTCVTEGNLRFTLVWEEQTDLDIYVKTPTGETVYYRNRHSSDGGVYERDACINTGCDSHQGSFVETIVWESAEPTNGTYEFWAENYDGEAAASIKFDVTYDGVRELYDGSVGGQQGATSSTYAITVGSGQTAQQSSGGGGGTTSSSGETYDGDEHDGQGVCGHRWHMPPSVQQAGAHQSVSRDRTGGSCSGGFTPGAREFGDRMRDRFRHLIDLDKEHTDRGIGGYACRNVRGRSSLSMHAVGRAVDIHIPVDTSEYNNADNAKGDIIANWLVENAEHIGIQYIIWDRAEWRGYRNSGTNSCYSGKHDHEDHLHVELTEEAANMQTPFF